MLFDINWKVEEVVNGPGVHDGGVRDGDRQTLASGQVQKEGTSADALRGELTEVLQSVYPRYASGPTYDLIRDYFIEIDPSFA